MAGKSLRKESASHVCDRCNSSLISIMSDQDDLLDILNAHGQSFLDSFSVPVAGVKRKRNEQHNFRVFDRKEPDSEAEESEWSGIGGSDSERTDNETDNEGDSQ